MSVPGTDLQGWGWLRGRARRREFWLWTVVIVAWSYFFAWAGDELPQRILATAFWLQAIRRLHDAGHSGWWIAAFVVVEIALAAVAGASPTEAWAQAATGLVALAGLIALGSLPGDRDENRFGPPPRRRSQAAAHSEAPIQA